VTFDELELDLRLLPGVVAVGFAHPNGSDCADDPVVVEVQVGPDASDDVARDVTRLAIRHLGSPVAVEIVRWGDGPPIPPETRLRVLEVSTDLECGEVAVHLARGDERAIGRASTSHGLLGVAEATMHAIRTYVPDLTYLAGWARTVETTPDRRFIVVASVTDPHTQSHLRGAAEGRTPLEAAANATLAALNRTISRKL